MRNTQNAKLSMYNVVLTIMDDNAAKVATVGALDNMVKSFKTTVEAISNTAEQQNNITKGITPDKNATRATLRSTTVNLAGILYAYAVSVDNIVLKELSKITRSSIARLKDDELAKRAQTIHDEAVKKIKDLPAFGITEAVLTSYQGLIDAYSVKSPAPRAAQSQKAALTQQLKALIKQADNQLKSSIDKLMLNFKLTEKEFFSTYTSGRVIVDAATSSTNITGVVTEGKDLKPVRAVAITVADKPYKAITNKKGKYTLRIPVPGVYNIKFTKEGFKEKTEDEVEVKLGQSTPLNVSLAA
jgi:hypothetical protein